MEGIALSWYQWMSRNGFLNSWPMMLQALESRFAPSFDDDPHGALFKLHQRGTINDYLTEFERLANCTMGLTPPFLLSCFISGLNLVYIAKSRPYNLYLCHKLSHWLSYRRISFRIVVVPLIHLIFLLFHRHCLHALHPPTLPPKPCWSTSHPKN